MKKMFVLSLVAMIALGTESCRRVEGCTDSAANNFDPDAKKDNGSCTYDVDAAAEQSEIQEASSDAAGLIYEDMQIYTYGDYEQSNNDTLRDRPLPSGCGTVRVDTSSGASKYPLTITIDFGTTGCTCADGKVRKGVIEYYISSSWVLPGTDPDTMRATLLNYEVDGHPVTGTRTFIRKSGLVNGGTLDMQVKVENAQYTIGSSTYKWAYTGEMTVQLNTLANYEDNTLEVEISGGSYTAPDNRVFTFSTESSKPLVATMSCLSTCLFTSGTLIFQTTYDDQLSVGNVSNLAIEVTNTAMGNFGTGTCDGTIEVGLSSVGVNKATEAIIYNETANTTVNCDDYVNVD